MPEPATHGLLMLAQTMSPLPCPLLAGVAAGTPVTGLRMVLLDASGAPARQSLAGKITASWKNGSKKVTWQGEPIKLPALSVSRQLGDGAGGWEGWLQVGCCTAEVGALGGVPSSASTGPHCPYAAPLHGCRRPSLWRSPGRSGCGLLPPLCR